MVGKWVCVDGAQSKVTYFEVTYMLYLIYNLGWG